MYMYVSSCMTFSFNILFKIPQPFPGDYDLEYVIKRLDPFQKTETLNPFEKTMIDLLEMFLFIFFFYAELSNLFSLFELFLLIPLQYLLVLNWRRRGR